MQACARPSCDAGVFQRLAHADARKEIRRLSADIIVRVNEKLKEFSETFDIQTPVSLGGNLKGLFKLRVGDY